VLFLSQQVFLPIFPSDPICRSRGHLAPLMHPYIRYKNHTNCAAVKNIGNKRSFFGHCTRAWLKCGTVGFLAQMWNSSCASICTSNGQYVNSTYGRHVFLSNKFKFIVTVSSYWKEMAKKSKGKETGIRRMSDTTGHQGAAPCY
jgi:hypothetical protein